MPTHDHVPVVPTAVLVGIKLPGITEAEVQSSLDELARLVSTLGYRVIGRLWQKRSSERTATVLGDGKLKELAKWTGGTGSVGPSVIKKKHKAALRQEKEEADRLADLEDDEVFEAEEGPEEIDDSEATATPTELAEFVVFDCDLSPSQLRNIENATGTKALDRTGVIIEIFSRHAKSRAARLQVEIARLAYVAPRLRESVVQEDRGGGGGTAGRGAGETTLELDRRHIRDRIKALKDEFIAIEQEHDTRRARRGQELTVALVGYTNAGKSSLMRALTGSEVLVADKLFATLDTTVRLLQPETRPRILVSDTVGFIKKLPHDLVASFKSTLDEATNAALLLYIVDASDPTFREQFAVTESVLKEVGAGDSPRKIILNKIDRVNAQDVAMLRREFPDAYYLSAINPDDVAELRKKLIQHFDEEMIEDHLLIPYKAQGFIGEIREKTRVLDEAYDENGVTLKLLGPSQQIARFKARLKREEY